MKKFEKEYYGSATYSIAIMEFNGFIETLENVENLLKDSIETLNIILGRKEMSEDMLSCLKKYPLTEFCKVQRYIEGVRRAIRKYQNRLEQYLQENPNKKQEFDLVLEKLNILVREKQIFITEQIDKCFNCIRDFNDQTSVD